MYEQRKDRLLSTREFVTRVMQHGGIVVLVLGAALIIGVIGYHTVVGLPWIDALLNASMILGGMGPVDPIRTMAGKLFASFYALFSGLLIIAASGILLVPFLHRLVHKFHLEKGD
jgi:hypothetical protein